MVLGGGDPVAAPVGLAADVEAAVVDSASDGLLLLAVKLPAEGVDLRLLPLEQSHARVGLICPKFEPNNKLEEPHHVMVPLHKALVLAYLALRVHVQLVVALKGIEF